MYVCMYVCIYIMHVQLNLAKMPHHSEILIKVLHLP